MKLINLVLHVIILVTTVIGWTPPAWYTQANQAQAQRQKTHSYSTNNYNQQNRYHKPKLGLAEHRIWYSRWNSMFAINATHWPKHFLISVRNPPWRHNRIKHNLIISKGQITIIGIITSSRTLIDSLLSRVIIRTQIDTMRTPTRTTINPKISKESNKCCNRCYRQFKTWLEP